MYFGKTKIEGTRKCLPMEHRRTCRPPQWNTGSYGTIFTSRFRNKSGMRSHLLALNGSPDLTRHRHALLSGSNTGAAFVVAHDKFAFFGPVRLLVVSVEVVRIFGGNFSRTSGCAVQGRAAAGLFVEGLCKSSLIDSLQPVRLSLVG